MAKTPLTVPIIHLNGSSGQSLIDGYLDVIPMLRDAQRALRLTTPHGRDYYVSKDSMALSRATTQHLERLDKIDEVVQELNELVQAVQSQLDARKR